MAGTARGQQDAVSQKLPYRGRIVVDPDILVGKPVVKGTRVPVELVIKHLAQNPAVDELLRAYPRLTLEDVKACLAYAQDLVEGEDVFPAEPTQH